MKLPAAQHKTLLQSADNQAALALDRWHVEEYPGNRLYAGHQRKLYKRGYLIRETRQTSPTSWSYRFWLTNKGWEYLNSSRVAPALRFNTTKETNQ